VTNGANTIRNNWGHNIFPWSIRPQTRMAGYDIWKITSSGPTSIDASTVDEITRGRYRDLHDIVPSRPG